MPASPDSPLHRAARYLWRVPFLFWHILVDLSVVMLLLVLPTRRIMVRGKRLEYRLIRW